MSLFNNYVNELTEIKNSINCIIAFFCHSFRSLFLLTCNSLMISIQSVDNSEDDALTKLSQMKEIVSPFFHKM